MRFVDGKGHNDKSDVSNELQQDPKDERLIEDEVNAKLGSDTKESDLFVLSKFLRVGQHKSGSTNRMQLVVQKFEVLRLVLVRLCR